MMNSTSAPHYEDRLGDAIEQLLEAGAEDLAALAAGLERLGIVPPEGGRWTEARLAHEFARLGT